MRVIGVVGWVGLASALAAAPRPQSHPPPKVLEQAERLLARDGVTFPEAADIADRLRAELARAGDSETRARLALAWVRTMRRTLGEIPMTVERGSEPYRGWLARHEADVVYSEPAGQWLIAPEAIWKLHDEAGKSRVAQAIAWEAVDNGLPGECEGYPPCYLSGFARLHGRYLEAHPAGEHAAEAASQIVESLLGINRLLEDPSGHELFNPKTDCDDMRKTSAALLTQLGQAPVAAEARAAVRKLASRCAKR